MQLPEPCGLPATSWRSARLRTSLAAAPLTLPPARRGSLAKPRPPAADWLPDAPIPRPAVGGAEKRASARPAERTHAHARCGWWRGRLAEWTPRLGVSWLQVAKGGECFTSRELEGSVTAVGHGR